MATADFEQVKDLVAKYGDKATIGRMAAMGMIEPTTAVLAGMMIDRITQQNMKPPTTTVAQDVLAPQPPPQMPQAAPMQPQPQPQPAPTQMAQAPQGAGVAALPVPENMYEYQGGGIVAFDRGGDVKKDEERKWYQAGPRNTFVTSDNVRPGMYQGAAQGVKDFFRREGEIIGDIYKERGIVGLVGQGIRQAIKPSAE